MNTDPQLDLETLHCLVIQLADRHGIAIGQRPIVEIFNDLLVKERKDAWLEWFTHYTPEEET